MRLVFVALLLAVAFAEGQVAENEFCKKNPHMRACQKERSLARTQTISQNDEDLTTVSPQSSGPVQHDVVPKKRNDERPPFEALLARRKARLQTLKAFLPPQEDARTDFTVVPLLRRRKREDTAAQEDASRKKRLHDYIDDDDYEYYLWRKFRREHMRRRGYHSRGNGYYYPSYGYGYPSYYYPSYSSGYSYPSYGGGYYPGYGGGYGGYGQAFNFGIGSGLNIGLPYGMGVGIGSGLGISVG
ncbi:hypothetical protein QR680_000776 [Steinernema hermaphroditum]|uniref:Uncharacterized protein n=1 Tax=Steinernema hermaphroditum TaxID=289476 RepID=A0AA39LEN9_9BILA|nr:hypothetical protein QR680_000776 [Steinernema hermaphroditum]